MKISELALAPQSDLDELNRLRQLQYDRNAIIEECARVAELLSEEHGISFPDFPAAIRASKDKA